MDIKLYTDIPLVKDLVSIYGDNVKIDDHIDGKTLELYLQFKNNDPPIFISNEDIYNYIKFIHFVLMDDEHYSHIAKYITKDNFHFFEDLFENNYIEDSLLLLLNYDVVKLYSFYDNIEHKYIIKNFHHMKINNKDVLNKFIVHEYNYTYCYIDSVFYICIHDELFEKVSDNLFFKIIKLKILEDLFIYSESDLHDLAFVKYIISLGIDKVRMVTLINFLKNRDIIQFLMENVVKDYDMLDLLAVCLVSNYSDTLYYLVSVGDKELNLGYISMLAYSDFTVVNIKTSVEMIECLINIGVDFFHETYMILNYFVENKHVEIIGKLLQVFKNHKNKNNSTLVKSIVDTNDVNILEIFDEFSKCNTTGFDFRNDYYFGATYCKKNNLDVSLKYMLNEKD